MQAHPFSFCRYLLLQILSSLVVTGVIIPVNQLAYRHKLVARNTRGRFSVLRNDLLYGILVSGDENAETSKKKE